MKELTLKKMQTESESSDTVIHIDVEARKIFLSDWESGPGISDRFGDSDIEWYYEIDRQDVEPINTILSEGFPEKDFDAMKEEERLFLSEIDDGGWRRLLRRLLSFMEQGNAFSLVMLLESRGIKIKKSCF